MLIYLYTRIDGHVNTQMRNITEVYTGYLCEGDAELCARNATTAWTRRVMFAGSPEDDYLAETYRCNAHNAGMHEAGYTGCRLEARKQLA